MYNKQRFRDTIGTCPSKRTAHLTLAFQHISVVSSFPRWPSQVNPEAVQGATTNVLVSPRTNQHRLFLQLKKVNHMSSLNSNVCCAGVWNHVHMYYMRTCVWKQEDHFGCWCLYSTLRQTPCSVMCTLLAYKLSDSLCLYFHLNLGEPELQNAILFHIVGFTWVLGIQT